MKNHNLNLNGFEIAVIGMSCRLPGARNINEYFNNLKDGKCSIQFFSKDDLRANDVPEEIINNPCFINAGIVIDDHNKFDAKFWNYPPQTAKMMSAEHKIALEEVWCAFENAGYDITKCKKKIGVFFSGGLVNETLHRQKGAINQFELLLASGADFLSTRIAYELGFTGPALNIQTACSSSLVAIHYACQSLLNGECSMAIAGGVTIDPPSMGYFYEEDMIFSKDGLCKSFDNESTGTVFSSGCGCVILKPFEDALRDNDRIDAIIKGSSVNNDGRRKMGFTAPSEEGQFKVITQAINASAIGSEAIGYIECHGSGTKLGDAIEIKALTRALQECKKSNIKVRCAIGSVKSNIGHAQSASGIAGFIKTVLSIKNALFFPSLHYENSSPRIDYDQSPLSVNTKLLNWTPANNLPRIAGVSAFGAGGTNAHILLSEMPKVNTREINYPYACSIFSLSAKSVNSLEMMRSELAKFLENNHHENLSDIAYMLHNARAEFQYRHMFISSSVDEAIKKLRSPIDGELIDKNNYHTFKNEQSPNVVFLCSGIGEHYFGMSKQLYDTIPYYRQQIDTCCDLLKTYLQINLLQLLFDQKSENVFNELMKKTEYMVPAVFIIGYAVAKLLMHWGINPQVLIGHSTGEYLAACLANVLPLKEMLHLIVRRAQIIDSLPNGSMIVVPLTEQEIGPYLNDDISIAAINGPFFCTLAGETKSIKNLVDKLDELGIASKYLPVNYAYHSKIMELGKQRLLELFAQFKFQPPTIPYISNVTGKFITDDEVMDPYYWYRHACETVYFSQGIQKLFGEDSLYIEIGPGNNLVSALLQHQSKEVELKNKAFSTIKGKNKNDGDLNYFFNTIGKLWLHGVKINWHEFYGYNLFSKLELPSYQFDKNEYLLSHVETYTQSIATQQKKLLIDNWFYTPVWKLSSVDNIEIIDKTILIFIDDYDIGHRLANILKQKNEVYKVSFGSCYEYDAVNKEYKISATDKSDYEKLFTDLKNKSIELEHIIHLCLLENNDELNEHEVTATSINHYQKLGFYSVLFIIQAMSLAQISNQVNLVVVGNGVYTVTGKENLYPEKATIQGLIKCIPQEHSHIICKYIDINFNENNYEIIVKSILAEFLSNNYENDLISYRNSDRFILDYKNIELSKSQKISKNFKANGTYLITGGLGGLGFIFAEYLAKNLKANLILTYHTALPDSMTWDSYLLKSDADINIAEKIRRILQLEKMGITVSYMQADVCNYASMDQVKRFIYANHKKLDGIIHCAGVTAGQFIFNKTITYSDKIFAPKLQGSLNLLQTFANQDVDFILFTSSTMAIDCFMGQSDYSGANAFLDAFTYYCNKRTIKKIAKPKFFVINWDGWQEIGAAEREQANFFKKRLESQNYTLKNFNHYLFSKQITDANASTHYYVSKFSPTEHWFLNEHKLAGVPTIPGTLYIELIIKAANFLNLKQSIYIEHLKFISPLRVSPDKSKEVYTVLNKIEDGIEAQVLTTVDNNASQIMWQQHVYGKITFSDEKYLLQKTQVIKSHIASLAETCKVDPQYLVFINNLIQRNASKENQIANWGDRWNCIKQVSTGKNCGILWLSLADNFLNDIQIFTIHPALLDVATSVIARKFIDKKQYLPDSYHGITVFAPLQQNIISYVELFDIDIDSDFLNCKITITDVNANILVEIQKFTMAAIGTIESNNTTEKPAFTKVNNLDFVLEKNILKNTLTPTEGLEAFKRIMNNDFNHVIVSTIALKDRIKIEKDVEFVEKTFPELSDNFTSTSKTIHAIWCKLFGYADIDENDNFFEVGGNSLLAIMLRNQINKHLNVNIGIVDIFAYPTIKKLNKHIFGEKQITNKFYEKSIFANEDIAVIGYSGIFPNSNDVNSYWENIVNGKECLSHLNHAACVELGVPAANLKDNDYVAAGVVFADIDKFDAAFWRLSPQDASIMDPQTRCFLEHTWKALEISGYVKQRSELTVGIFCGSGWSQYLVKNLFTNAEIINSTTAFELNTLGDKDFLATQVAYILDLHGPVMNIDTACSTSLVAIAEACNKLQSFKCELAIAGGVNLLPSDQFGYSYKEGSIYSKDGYCRVFDSEASGTVISGGAGVVVLKRLSDAKRDNDHILAVIKGYGINNDGRRKVGFTAPSMLGQKDCILEAQRCAGINAEDISYVECHGTGTLIGDPIEIQALTEAFQENTKNNREAKCVLGSVKANVGHANKAAGVASFIKVCEMLQNKIIPPSINYVQPNPELKLNDSPFEIINESRSWNMPEGNTRIAGISSFGIGGTNAHIILTEAPQQEPSSTVENNYKLLCLSAKSSNSLHNMQEELKKYLLKNPQINLEDVAYTLQVGRESFPNKCLIVCKEVNEALTTFTELNDTKSKNLIFMFSGQGTQYVNMGEHLYDNNKVFKKAIDACANILQSFAGYDSREILYPKKLIYSEAEEKLNNTRFTQPALFVLEYALYKLWESLEIKPIGLIGHSLGEYVAACVSGVFSLEDALKLVEARGRLIAGLPLGAMLAVGRTHALIEHMIPKNLSLAAINSDSSCVLSGPKEQILELAEQLKDQKIFCHILQTSHAFHSAMMEPMLASFAEVLQQITFNPPNIPIISNITGDWLKTEEAQSKEYWLRHIRETVNFNKGLTELFKIKDAILLEVGPGSVLANLALQHSNKNSQHKILTSLPQAKELENSEKYFFTTFGKLWLSGHQVNFTSLYNQSERRNKVVLPTYLFEKHRHWIEPNQVQSQQSVKTPLDEWFYVPSWKRLPFDILSANRNELVNKKILIFKDAFGVGEKLFNILKNNNEVYKVSTGNNYEYDAVNKEYKIKPTDKNAYQKLLLDLNEKKVVFNHIIHLWLLTNNETHVVTEKTIAHYQEIGFFSVLLLIQSLNLSQISTQTNLTVIGNGVYSVTGKESLYPEKATIQGLIKCIPQEYSNVICKYIDIESDDLTDQLFNNIMMEILQDHNLIVAYRNQYRWLENYENICLPAINSIPKMLKKNGTYLITGGFGGVGSLVAEYLAKDLNANLILMSRTKLPDKITWSDYLSMPNQNSDITNKIQTLLQLESLGASIYPVYGDVSSYEDMQQVKKFIEKNFEKVNAIFHCAGVSSGKLLFHNNRERINKVFASKLTGTLNIYKIFANDNLDFLMLFSSTMSIKCMLGQADYAGANAFLDSFSHYAKNQNIFSVNWDAWHNIGMTIENTKNSLVSIHAHEGLEVFKRLLDKKITTQIIVSTTDSLLEDCNLQQNVAPNKNQLTNDSLLQVSKDELEQQLIKIWQEILGYKEISLNDSFFDLGGTSLKIIKMKEKVDELISSNLKITDYFNYATINLLTEKLMEGKQLNVLVQNTEMPLINERKDRIDILHNKRKNSEITT